MVSEIPIVSVFGHCPYSVTFPYSGMILYIIDNIYIFIYHYNQTTDKIHVHIRTHRIITTFTLNSITFVYTVRKAENN